MSRKSSRPCTRVIQLRERYAEVFGEATATDNRTWLVRRIAWRIQANTEGEGYEKDFRLGSIG